MQIDRMPVMEEDAMPEPDAAEAARLGELEDAGLVEHIRRRSLRGCDRIAQDAGLERLEPRPVVDPLADQGGIAVSERDPRRVDETLPSADRFSTGVRMNHLPTSPRQA